MSPKRVSSSLMVRHDTHCSPLARCGTGLLLTIWLVVAALPAPAATVVWDGTNLEADDNWTTGDNWLGGVAPLPGDSLVFGNAKQTNENDFPTNTPFAAITFTNGNWILTGAPLTLTNAGVAVFWNQTSAPSYSNTLNMPVTFASDAIISNLAPARALVFNGALSNGGNLIAIGTVAGGMVALNGLVVGAGGLTKTGGGTLVLANSGNSFSNDTTISAGTLKLGVANVIPDGSGRGDVIVNGTLDMNGKNETINGLTGSGLITNSSATAVSLTVCNENASSTFTFDGYLKGNLSLSKGQSSPILVLTRQNTYTGGTTNKNGTLRLGTDNALPPTTFLALGINNNINTLDLGGYSQQVGGLAQGVTNNNAKIANSSTTSNSTLTFSNSVNASTYAGVIVDAVSGGNKKVNLTVAGGTLTLTGTNTYSGATIVTNSESKLIVTTRQTGGGAFAIYDGAHLGVIVTSSNASLNVASLTLGASAANDGTLTLDLGNLGNPTNAPIAATSLSATGTVAINITGTGLRLGQFPLIKYSGAIGGAGFGAFAKGSLPAGMAADLVNNTANSSIDLNVKAFAGSVVWRGETNGVPVSAWNIGATTNWTDPATGQPDVYNESVYIGDVVLFDDSASNATVTVTTAVKSGMITVSSDVINYTIGGPAQIVGEGWLVKQGAGTLTLTSANSFSGGSTLSEGVVRAGHNTALGLGLVTLNGGSLSSGSTSSRTLANNVSVLTASAIGDTNASFNGPLSFSGSLDLNNATRTLTVHSPVTWTGNSGNGRFHKLGAGTLSLQGVNNWNGDGEVRDGVLVLNGGAFTNSGVLRVDAEGSAANSAWLIVTNGASLVLTGTGANLRCGYDVASGAATNILDIAGTVRMPNATTGNGRLILGRQCSFGQANLLSGGDLEVRYVQSSDNTATTVGVSEFNFDGGVLRAKETNPAFIAGLTNLNIRNGGAIIDSGGFDITIAQPLLGVGSGGLTKIGLGTLTLTSANIYTGPTTVNAGRLAVTTAHAGGGAFAIADGATLAVTVAFADSTLNASGLILGSISGATNELNLGSYGNPTVPAISTATLTTHGSVTLKVSGGGFTVGHFALIQHTGAIGGSGFGAFTLGPLPQGLGAFLSNGPTAVELVITNFVPLVWTGNADTNWDIGTTLNWQLNSAPTNYQDGDTVLFNDTAAKSDVYLTTNVAPGGVTVSNAAKSYAFSGPGKLNGATRLTKDGSGTLTLNTTNTYSGDTLVNGGSLKLGTNSSIASSVNITVASNALLDVSAVSGGLNVASGHSLSGYGTITGAVTVAQGGSLAPGASPGTLTFLDSLTVQGTVTITIRKTGVVLTGNKLAVGKLMDYGGSATLTVVAQGDALAGGEVFDLFDADSFTGMFYSNNLPALGPGLNWSCDQLAVDGTISVNRAPTAGNLGVQTLAGIPVEISIVNLVALCSDPDHHPLSVVSVSNPAHGTAVLNAGGSALIYAPAGGYTGTDSFTYTISDGHGGTNSATITVSVASPADSSYNRFSMAAPTGGNIQLRYTGFPTYYYVIQRSTNLLDWVDILATAIPTNGLLSFVDTTLPSPPPNSVFYRAIFELGTAEAESANILQATGVKGGFVVHVGCGDGRLTAALRPGSSYLVHGLDRYATNVATARSYIQSLGLYGPVSVEQWSGTRLPYVDGFVNLAVVEDMGTMTTNEVNRVLAPLGVAYYRQGSTWTKYVKPWPSSIDEWTHYLHDASGTCVGNDTVAGPPKRLQWTAGPRFPRHHDVTSSFNASVSAKGRFFYIIDDGSRESIMLPSHYSLYARDAFNGTLLWKRSISSWHPNMYGYKSGPTQLTRRLVAVGDVVYAPLDYYGPLNALDAATGATIRTYNQTQTIEEVICSDGVLFVMVNPDQARWPIWQDYYDTNIGLKTPNGNWNTHARILMAIDPATGTNLWQMTNMIYPGSLTADSTGVVYHDGNYLHKLDRATGTNLWQSSTAVPALNPWYTAFGVSMIMYKDTVLFTDGSNNVYSVSSTNGQVLAKWAHDKNSINNAPRDLFALDDLVWSTAAVTTNPVCKGYDRYTGVPVKTNDPGLNITWIHQRCYRNKATVKYFVTSRCGIEFIDTQKSWGVYNDWVRGSCLYGVIPANGFVYATPNNCACFYEMKLTGLNAQAPAHADTNYPVADPENLRLQTGPAYGQAITSNPAGDDWPTYRHDFVRSAYTTNQVSTTATEAWQTTLNGTLSGLTVAEGKLFVSSVNTHTVWALDAGTGSVVWSYTPGGPVDSPPTIYNGRVIFGCTDGSVYCLRAADGALIWRYQAAPTDLRITSYEQLESVWPVSGSVLVLSNKVYCVSGRSMFLDGGLRLLMLDPTNGAKFSEIVMDDKVPGYYPSHPGESLQALDLNLTGPVGLPDILSSDGQYFYMKSQQFALDGTRQHIGPYTGTDANNTAWTNQIGPGVHLFTPTGVLDDTWVHRSYWVWGRAYSGGAGGYYQAGKHAPCGQILAIDDANVYGFGRKQQYYQWTRPKENILFSTSNTNAFNLTNPFNWSNSLPFFVKAMVVAGNNLFIAGPPDVEDEVVSYASLNDAQTQANLAAQDGALSGALGGQFRVVDKATGATLSMQTTDWLPAWDGMIVAKGSVYVATRDGRVICLR